MIGGIPYLQGATGHWNMCIYIYVYVYVCAVIELDQVKSQDKKIADLRRCGVGAPWAPWYEGLIKGTLCYYRFQVGKQKVNLNSFHPKIQLAHFAVPPWQLWAVPSPASRVLPRLSDCLRTWKWSSGSKVLSLCSACNSRPAGSMLSPCTFACTDF